MPNASKLAWDPTKYLRFEEYRSRPAAELLSRVPLEAPERVYDLGCGPGNSTRLLRQRWPKASITGVDYSEDMLTKARELNLDAEWQLGDIASWSPKVEPDLIFSNATLQWLGDHEVLFLRLLGLLKSGGVLAVQMPRNFTSASHTIVQQIVETGPWAARLKPVRDFKPVARPEDYYNILASGADRIDIWETEYTQVLTGDDAVFSWMSGTALLPYFSKLNGQEREKFIEECRSKLAAVYQPRDNDVTLFPFRRLFIVAVAR